MILPTKHIRYDRALIAVGADILILLRQPMTVSRLWDEVRGKRGNIGEPAPINYAWFVLALDLLFMIGAVDIKRGVLRRSQP